MSALEVYNAEVRAMPADEQLRLAGLILRGVDLHAPGVDFSWEWSDEDIEEFTQGSWQLALAAEADDRD
jgi:hypothetical protein